MDKQIKSILIWMLVIGLVIRSIFAFLPSSVLKNFVYDDSFYYFSVAKIWIQTGQMFSADGVTVTSGFHPLWLLSIMPIFALSPDGGESPVRMVLLFSGFLWCVGGVLLFKLLNGFFEVWIQLVLVGIYLLSPVTVIQSVTGMETSLNVCCILLLLLLVVRREDWWTLIGMTKWSLWLGAISGLCFLVRTDNIFLVVAAWIYLVIRDGSRKLTVPVMTTTRILSGVSVAIVIVAPYLILSLVKTGSFMQGTFWAYPWLFHNEFLAENGKYLSWAGVGKILNLVQMEFKILGEWFGSNVMLACLVGGWLVFWSSFKKSWIVTRFKWAYVGVGIFIFIHVFIRWFPKIWYQAPLFIVLLPVLGFLITELKTRKIFLLGLGFVYLMVSVVTVTTLDAGSSGAFMRAWTKQGRANIALQLIEKKVPSKDIVGAWNSGYPEYYSSHTVINLDGLANNEIVQHYKNRTALQYLRSRNIKWLVDSSFFFTWSYGKYFSEEELKNCFKVRYKVPASTYLDNEIWLVEVLPDSSLDVK